MRSHEHGWTSITWCGSPVATQHELSEAPPLLCSVQWGGVRHHRMVGGRGTGPGAASHAHAPRHVVAACSPWGGAGEPRRGRRWQATSPAAWWVRGDCGMRVCRRMHDGGWCGASHGRGRTRLDMYCCSTTRRQEDLLPPSKKGAFAATHRLAAGAAAIAWASSYSLRIAARPSSVERRSA